VPGMSQADIARIAQQMGLDRPLPVQYWDWFTHLLLGDWGRSYRDSQPVLTVIGSHLWATLELMITATLIAILLGAWIGVMGAIRRYSIFDSLATIGAMIALSIPTFWFGLVTIYIFSVKLGWLPSGNRYTIGDGSFWDYLHHLIAPSLVLALVEVAVWSRYMRASMLDVINQDFIRTARAKGLADRVVLYKHALRNAVLPVVTVLGLQFGNVLAGAILVETVFNWPGLGRLAFESVLRRDYPTILGVLVFSSIVVIVMNLLTDLAYRLIDPRIKV